MKKLILLITICVLSVILTLIFYSFYRVAFVQTVSMDLEVGDNVGFNLDTDKLHFGKTFPGGVLSRKITVGHNVDARLRAHIVPSGEIKEWVLVPENNFHLANREVKNLTVYVNVPEDAEYGNYTGTLEVFFQRTIT